MNKNNLPSLSIQCLISFLLFLLGSYLLLVLNGILDLGRETQKIVECIFFILWLNYVCRKVLIPIFKQTLQTKLTIENHRHKWMVIGIVGIMLITLIVTVVEMPYPPIFNIHAYVALTLGRYFNETLKPPFFDLFTVTPSAVFTVLYPSQMLLGYLFKWLYLFLGNSESYIIFANLMLLTIFFMPGLALTSVFPEKTNRLSVLTLFFCTILGAPPLYEVFVKYPGGDAFTLFSSSTILFLSIRFLIARDFKMLCFVMAFSTVLRVYLIPIQLLFLGLAAVFSLLFFRIEMKQYCAPILKEKKNIGFLTLCLLLALSWPTLFYFNYKTPIASFDKMGIFNSPLTENEKLAQSFLSSEKGSLLVEKSNYDELKNSVFAKSVYYKTYSEKHFKPRHQLTQFLASFFSTTTYLLVIIFTVTYGVGTFILTKGFYRPHLFTSVLWISACGLTWYFLRHSYLPTSKILISTLPALALLVSVVGSELSFGKKWNQILFISLLVFFSCSFAFNQLVLPLTLSTPNDQFARNDFVRKYGFKKEILNYLNQNSIPSENILWVVRGEHGGFLPYFYGDKYLWQHQWYDSPRFLDIHLAKNPEDLVIALQKKNITHIVAMHHQDIERFIKNTFRKNLNYPEIIIDLLTHPNNFLKSVFNETPGLGLEMGVFQVVSK